MFSVVIDGLLRLQHSRARRERFPRVEVAVELGKGRGSDLDADAVSLKKHLRRVPYVYLEFIDLVGLDQGRRFHPITIAPAQCRHSAAAQIRWDERRTRAR